MIFFQLKRRAKFMQLFYLRGNKRSGFRQDGKYYSEAYLGKEEIAFDDRWIAVNDPVWISFKIHNEEQKDNVKDII